ncbi:MAG: hypothetical protein ABW007_17030 [Chitinophagaceae bacterium]
MGVSTILPGTWEGDYIDVRGYKGILEMKIEARESELSGQFKLTVKDIDKPQIFEGSLKGESNEKETRLSLMIYDKESSQDLQFSHEIKITDAGTYASQCFYGMVTSVEKSVFGGGVWIAWHFKNKNKQ